MSINKEIVEKVKTVTITALVVGILAFIGGIKYQNQHLQEIKTEAKSMVTASAQVVKSDKAESLK